MSQYLMSAVSRHTICNYAARPPAVSAVIPRRKTTKKCKFYLVFYRLSHSERQECEIEIVCIPMYIRISNFRSMGLPSVVCVACGLVCLPAP